MDWLIHGLSGVMMLIGAFLVFVGGFGVVRMPDLHTRMHAASLTDTLGGGLLLSGLMLESGLELVTLKIAAVAAFLLFTGPVSAYALANAARVSGEQPHKVERPQDSGA